VPDASPPPVARPGLATALLGVSAVAGIGALAATGHDRVVAVLALATLLVAVLDATARALTDRHPHDREVATTGSE
jgi:hypothetical protein